MKFAAQVEWLPKIRACNFVVTSPDHVEDDNITVTIEESCVLINFNGTCCLELRFSSLQVTLVPDSLSGLSSIGRTILFRARINSLTCNIERKNAADSTLYKSIEDLQLYCASCIQPVSKTLRFSRALPLPSNGEMDFFCHRHSEHKISLDPRPSDLFYDHLIYVIHSDNFELERDDADLKCSKCSTVLGEIKNETVRIWKSDVLLESSAQKSVVQTSRVNRFLTSLLYLMNDVPTQMNKFVFTCKSSSKVKYSLLWIMDKSLVLSFCESNSCQMDLKTSVGKKVLYSQHNELTPEVEDFINSPSSLEISLSPSGQEMLSSVLKFMSRNIPEEFSTVNQMKVSYLMVVDDSSYELRS